ncbi:hypothetical protein DID88_008338 [Monilinia fructigena]|uniref:Myosin motor domain-containing protein n=1 Tax=Monilinia fructigena TaxID=38457 RepID=A0A395J4Z9_9HELO|nr:hypothetical protein DID88_008338 [Monilinia fructigena]
MFGLKDPQTAFVKGWIVEELENNHILVQCDDGSQREVDAETVDKVNPAKFDKANDMAELTHLNEASVVHNLHMRYQADLIYTYSGLFLVTINPYCSLPIYTNEYINMYKGQSREETKPHIFAMADEAFRNLVEEGENQSILVTGESGAGKTENTKKVIQYLAAVANSESPVKNKLQHSTLSQQILRANPILEAFGNAQTVRNHNSSRFGKFIRIEFTRNGSIAGAFIDWYLLEKSRVVRLNAHERNYHIFYQLLKGADPTLKQEFLIEGLDVEDFAYTRDGHDTIVGVSDRDEWNSLVEAFNVMGFSEDNQMSILRTVAAVLHLGNITVVKESRSADQARLAPEARAQAERVCWKRMGRKGADPEQVLLAIDSLAKGIYERGFGDLVTRINRQLDRTGMGLDDSHFIGVLDIAGFEIFEENSFEQLCINYTNEKLQQFFNHHMFVLEQEEYAREKIEWKFIDFGHDLQPTIDLIELPNPIGIFSCLDEDCVMPKATDKSFTEKLHSLWDRKTPKYRASRLGQGFMLTHYAAEVEYSTEGWLEKNKDPMNDNITRLLAASSDPHVANLFSDCSEAGDDSGAIRSRVKKEFRQRYEVLCRNMTKGYLDGQTAASMMLDKLQLDKSLFRVGITKVFFRAGVLAELEEQRDALIREIMTRFQSMARGFTQRRIANKRLYRAEATRIIQRNFQVYIDLCENPWWRLLVKMKPLLGATRTSGEVKKRDEMIKQLNEKMDEEAAERQRLDEERRNTHTEMLKIQQTLESERALALDKEEIFKRLQLRETELSDKLAGAIEDQEKLEDQLDDLLEAKKRAEYQSNEYRSQLEQAGHIIAKLESEKRDLSQQLIDLDNKLKDLAKKQADRSAQEAQLSQDVQLLQSQLSIKDRKVYDLEAKIVKIDQDAEVKLATAAKDLQASKLRESDLASENRKVQKQLFDLSATSTGYEDLVRRKESELAILRSDNRKYEAEKKSFDEQKRSLSADKDNIANRLKEVQAEIFSEVQKDLSKERQSRDDVQLLAEHKFRELSQKFQELNEAKIIIEKELYVQQDTLRRAMENRVSAEKERNEARNEIRKLREAKIAAEEARIQAEVIGDRNASRLAREREASLKKDLEAEQNRAKYFETECSRLNQQVEDLNKIMIESGDFGLKVDQEKERLERELKHGSKTSSRASESSRGQLIAAQREKAKVDEQNKTLNKQLGDAQIQLTSLQKQKEKLELSLEDLTREVEREHMSSRNAEKVSSTVSTQLAEANRKLEDERQLHSQAQAKSRQLQFLIDSRDKDIVELMKIVDPEMPAPPVAQYDGSTDKSTPENPNLILQLTQKVEELQQNLRVQAAGRSNAEAQVLELRKRYEDEFGDSAEWQTPGRSKLEEINANEGGRNASPTHIKKQAQCFNNRMDLKADVEELQNQLQLSQMENRHLQSQLERSTPGRDIFEDSPSHTRAVLEVDLRDAKSDLEEMALQRDQDAASRNQLLQEFADLQIRLDAESSKLADVSSSLGLYKSRADEYFSKLEQAEIAVLKASRAEQFARSQAKEAEDTCAEIMSERKQMDETIEDLQKQNQHYEEKLEDLSSDLDAAVQARKRLQHELEDYRKKKYQAEFATLTNELDIAREEKLFKQTENTRLREELDQLRSKWDDEVLNSSTWSKEKARLESTLADLNVSRDEAVNAHNEAQGKIVSLLAQVRSLRTDVDDAAAERDILQREKRGLQTRLEEAKAGLDDLARSDSPALRNAAGMDREILELKSNLAQQEDIAAAAVGKMRRSEALVSEIQKDIVAEREMTAQLSKEKAQLEKSLKETQVRLLDLETKGYSSASQDVRFLHGRVQELEAQLDEQESERNKSQRSVRNVDRTVKDLQQQIERKEKANTQLQEDITRSRDKVEKLLKTIDELQSSDSTNQLSARRAERELREEREKALRLERELEGWKALRMQKGPGGRISASGTWRPGSEFSSDDAGIEIPKRKSSLSRQDSMSKGFL